MSKPRYDWWPYVKGMIRRYPELCERQRALRETPLTPSATGLPRGKGGHADPVANAALRQLPETNQRELKAVRKAVEQTRALPDGERQLELVRLVFWAKTCTVAGAARRLYVSTPTAVRWHGMFIRRVALNFGLLDKVI